MKYAIHYDKRLQCLNDTDEIILIYNKSNPSIIDFIKNEIKIETRLILDVTDFNNISNDLSIFAMCKKEHPNFALKLNLAQNGIAPDLYELNIDFFYSVFIDTWDKLLSIKNSGVSDVYITSDLGFSLDKVRKVLGDNINIRIYPNVAQTSAYDTLSNKVNSIYKFWVRPDDLITYEKYIDIIEFFGPTEKQEVLFKIYKQGYWRGDLKDIILNFDKELGSSYIVPHFAERRSKCEKECFKGNKCNICGVVEELANTLKDKGIMIVQEKEKEHYDEQRVTEAIDYLNNRRSENNDAGSVDKKEISNKN